MPLDARRRSKILASARRWIDKEYDYTHSDVSWKDLLCAPSSFDCSTFVCRVAIDSLGYAPELLTANAGWLLENLVECEDPKPGDVVGYGRAPDAAQYAAGEDVQWHVMLYLGAGTVIGACDVSGAVAIRPMAYEPELANRQWMLVEPAFRTLELRPSAAPVPLATIALRRRR